MKKCFTLAFCIAILSVIISKGQSTLAELQLPAGKVKNIQSYVVLDTIFLSVDVTDPNFNVDSKRFYLISSDGNSHPFSTTLIGNAPLCGVSKYDHEYYLYYLSGKRKNLELNTVIYNKATGQQQKSNVEIEIDGTLVGSWLDRDLFLAVYSSVSNELKVIRIN